MINIKKLIKKDVGRFVIYREGDAWGCELGRIKSWNDKFIFVVYKCGGNWNKFKNYTGQATNPEDIKYVLQ